MISNNRKITSKLEPN